MSTPRSRVDSVVVRPGTIHASGGAEFTLRAVAKGHYGTPVPVPVLPDLAIAWESTRPGVVLNPAANPATVRVPADPGTSFQLRARVTWSQTLALSLAWPRQIHSNWVTVHVTPTGAQAELVDDGSDWIRVGHVPGNPPALLLVQGAEGSVEVADWSVGVVGSARLARNFTAASTAATELASGAGTGTGAAVSNELAVFARDREAELWPPGGPAACRTDPTNCPWTDAADHLDAPLEPFGFRTLPVRAAVVDPNATEAGISADAWARGQAKQAFGILNDLRVGLGLDLRPTVQHSITDPETGAPRVDNPYAVCAAIDAYLPDPHSPLTAPELFVVFVKEIVGYTGFACPSAGWVGRVILISTGSYTVTTLVHEMGHVLSMDYPFLSGANGHTNGRPGFDHGNLMHNASPLDQRSARNHLTLGQAYRMNAHPGSWLNSILAPTLKRERPCAPSEARGICPALAADAGW